VPDPGCPWPALLACLGHKDRAALFIITVIMIGGVALVCPVADTPLIDDWTYAWSVEHLLTTGQLRVLDYSAHYPFAQIVMAAPFAAAFGFSFVSLRLSTLMMAWLGLLAFFLTLRVLGVDRTLGVLATLALLYNPVFFVLTLSFMTDVPFVAAANVAILGYVSWVKHRHAGALCLGGGFALIASLIRQIGTLVTLVPLGYLLFEWFASRRRPRLRYLELVLLALPLGALGLLWVSVRQTHGVTSQFAEKAQALQFLLSGATWLTPTAWLVYLKGMVHAASHLALVLAPFALWPLWPRQNRRLSVSAALAVLAVTVWLWQVRELPNLLELGQTLSWDELGASWHLLGDPRHPGSEPGPIRVIPAAVWWATLALCLASVTGLVVAIVEALRRVAFSIGPAAIIAVSLLLQFVAIEALWLYYDRYYLPLLPGVIFIVFAAMPNMMITRVAVAGGVALLAGVSISGAIDNFRLNAAVADARQSLLAQGIAPWAIDAGYPLNGWWLYAHPENLPNGSRAESDVPLVTGANLLPYKIATGPLPSYKVIEVVTWPSVWATADRLYILRKSMPP
jgi:hypothetical protein